MGHSKLSVNPMSFCYWQANKPSVSCLDEDAHLPETFVSSWHLALTAQEVARGAVTERDSQRASVKIYFLCFKRLPLAIILDLVKFT